jgi:predicted short-subunit dehydrogenase-like oxidoreductase (DUF2520 family)
MAPTLNIVGAGHVGRVLGRLFGARRVRGAGCADPLGASAQAAVAFIGAGRAVGAIDQLRRPPCGCWPCSTTASFRCAALAAGCEPLAGAVVFHCSGAKASTELARCARPAPSSPACIRCAASPIRRRWPRNFDGTFCGVEGDAEALAVLTPALRGDRRAHGADRRRAKTVYHAASVFASNYLVTVLDAALRAYQAAGIRNRRGARTGAAAGHRVDGQCVPAGRRGCAQRAGRARRHGHRTPAARRHAMGCGDRRVIPGAGGADRRSGAPQVGRLRCPAPLSS